MISGIVIQKFGTRVEERHFLLAFYLAEQRQPLGLKL